MSGICCSCAQSYGQDTVRLTLNDAIELALRGNTDLIVAQKQEIVAERYKQEINGGFLPKVTISGDYTRNIDKQVIYLPEGSGMGGGPTQIGSDNTFNTSLDLNIPLYSRTSFANMAYANVNLNLQRETLRGTRQTVITNVKKSYFNYVVGIATVEVRKKGVNNARQNLQNTEEKLSKGVATEFDKASASVKLTTAKNNLLEAETNLIPLANKLKILLGILTAAVISPADSLTVSQEELLSGPVLGDLLSNNSTEKQMRLKTTLAEQQSKITSSAYFPTVVAVGNYQIQSQNNNLKFSEYDWVRTNYLGLKLSFPIFNGTITKRKLQQAVLSEEIALKQQQLAIENNRAQYEQITSQLGYSKQRISLHEENIHLSENAFELAKERYKYGKGTFLEMSNAEYDYTTAWLNYLQAVLDYKSAYFDYELLIGKN